MVKKVDKKDHKCEHCVKEFNNNLMRYVKIITTIMHLVKQN